MDQLELEHLIETQVKDDYTNIESFLDDLSSVSCMYQRCEEGSGLLTYMYMKRAEYLIRMLSEKLKKVKIEIPPAEVRLSGENLMEQLNELNEKRAAEGLEPV